MLLRDLQPGQRFVFADKNTPIALTIQRGQHTAKGDFTYVSVGEGVCPKLLHETTGKEIVAVSSTYHRYVIRLF